MARDQDHLPVMMWADPRVPDRSASTHAGLVTGMIGSSSEVPVTGISVRAEREPQELNVHDLANGIAGILRLRDPVLWEAITVSDDYVGPGYSLPTGAMTEAIQMVARIEAVLLDPVYTGKAAAGLIGMVRDGCFTAGQNVLPVHTGGSPALYAYQYTVLAPPQSKLAPVGRGSSGG